MSSFAGFLKKEFFHILRDVRTLLILFGIPVAQLLIFGFVVSNDIKDVKIAVLDLSSDQVTREIKDKITSSGNFVLGQNIYHTDEIEKVFKSGTVKEVIVFGQDFAQKFENHQNPSLQIITDASEPNTARLISAYTSGIVRDYVNVKNKNMPQMYKIDVSARMQFNQGLKGVYSFVPGTMALILMLISAMMTSIAITREKEFGSMEVMLVSPLRPIEIIAGKVLPYALLSFLNSIIIVVLGVTVFGLPIIGNFALLLLICCVYILLSLSIGIFISTKSATQQNAMFISLIGLMLPTMLLSGFIFPIENMPRILQWLCAVMPARWFIEALKDVMIKGLGLKYIWQDLSVLIGMTVFFIALSVKNFKVRLG